MEHMIWNPTMECMPRDQLRALQDEHLRDVVRRVYESVPFYRDKMQKMGITPNDIHGVADINLLPFTEKQDLRDHYPFGLFAVPQTEIIRIHASSGTTGKPTVVGYTSGDIDRWAEMMARSMYCANIGKHDIVQVAYGYGLFTGGLGAHYGAERVGASVIPISGGNTTRQLMLIQDFGSTALCCTPSYALNLAEALHASGVRRTKLKSGVFGAEPWTEAMRVKIEDMLGIDAINIYGLSEVMGPGVSVECMCKNGMHIWEDHFLPEIIGEHGESLGYGEQGDLTFTTLTKHGMPLLRYRTHDLCTLTDEPCACGRTHVRMGRVMGRTDDMLIIRGVNVFPSQVEHALLQVEGIVPQYQIVVDRQNNLDTMEVQVELSPEFMSDTIKDMETLEARIVNSIASHALVHATVKLCQPGTLPRSEGKAKRVTDKRQLT
ncbi:MAG TPA: phenylacetate--CoA ligase [Candidatus Limiplasma sp.]|nr:phenylacetate--CoA ligase [Candidatus Limiplasma sp.]